MASIAPTVELNNGRLMPVLGLGTFQLMGNEGKELIKKAIDAGYRHFDTALLYHSEPAVGEAVKEKIADGTVKREDIFITSKLWCSYAHSEMVVRACQLSLRNLGLDYIDLYLIHWPFAFKPVPDPDDPVKKEFKTVGELMTIDEYFPRDATGNLIMCDVDYVDIWKEMEECVAKGLAKSIGVSNFNSQQIDRILEVATIKPVANEVEAHPYFNQKKLIEFCKDRDIFLIAYSPLSSGNPMQIPGVLSLFQDETILKLAKELDKTPAQVILRYMIQLGTVVIPKTANPKRLVENIAVFDFSLSPEQMDKMDSLNLDQRNCIIPGTQGHKNYPFNIEF